MSEAALTTTEYTPFIESDPTNDADILRARMAEYGYLFFRSLVPAEVVLQARQDVLEILQAAGWLDPAYPIQEARVRPGIEPKSEGDREYAAVYRQILRLPSFHNFPAHESLLAIATILLNQEAFIHPRRIGRITFPGAVKFTTPAHQDFFYIRGSVETYSCWTPLGACPMDLGGLAVLPGSHKQGFLEHSVHHVGAVGGRGVPVDESQASWHTSDFGVGDALFFRSYTIHKALPNLSANLLRLSTDNRYQVKEDEIDPSALQRHGVADIE